MILCLASNATSVRALGGCVDNGTAPVVVQSIVTVLAVAAAAEVGGCSCRGCGGGSWWLFLPWLRRRRCVGEGVETRSWMPPRQLVAAVPRGSRGVVGEGVGEGVGTRGWMPPRQLGAVVPRGPRGVVGEGVGEG